MQIYIRQIDAVQKHGEKFDVYSNGSVHSIDSNGFSQMRNVQNKMKKLNKLFNSSD